RGLPVIGGDFVLVMDRAGKGKATSVAQDRAIRTLSTSPKLTSSAAADIAKAQLKAGSDVEGARPGGFALNGGAPLAWEITVAGTGAEGYSRLAVDVDAQSGALINKTERVMHGTGNAWISGTVTLATTQVGSTFSMRDPVTTNLSCQDAANNTTFSG